MSPRMYCEIKICICSWSNVQLQFITHVSICAIAVACPNPVQLPVGAIAVSWKSSYICGISIMILLHLAQGSPEGTYKVVWVIKCVLEWEVLGSASHVMSWEFRMLAVCFTQKEYRLEVNEGRRDIYTRDSTISWFNLFCCLRTQNFPPFIMLNHQAQDEWRNRGWDLELLVRTVNDTWRCFRITYLFHHSGHTHHQTNWVLVQLSQLWNHQTWLRTPCGGRSTPN
jgi:hypothetical protein